MGIISSFDMAHPNINPSCLQSLWFTAGAVGLEAQETPSDQRAARVVMRNRAGRRRPTIMPQVSRHTLIQEVPKAQLAETQHPSAQLAVGVKSAQKF